MMRLNRILLALAPLAVSLVSCGETPDIEQGGLMPDSVENAESGNGQDGHETPSGPGSFDPDVGTWDGGDTTIEL